MASGRADIVWRHLCHLVTEHQATASDSELLQRYVACRDQAAFEALVRRHGPLVLGVCRRVLHHWHGAEDAFQATFLILARKAGSISKRESLAAWLCRVAHHVAVRSRAGAAARAERERRAATVSARDPLEELTARELLATLDEELHRLPERYRVPLVLCYLAGHTRDEAARQLGWSLGTLKRRLEEGKQRLRSRLARRGLELSAVMLAAALAQGMTRAVPSSLISAAACAAAGSLVATSSWPAALAAAVLHTMAVARLRTLTALLLVFGSVGLGLGVLSRPAPVAPTPAVAAGGPPPVPAGQKGASPPQARPAHSPAATILDGEAEKPGKDLTISGRVLDQQGSPVPEADVALIGQARPVVRAEDQTGAPMLLAQGKADRDGRYQLTVAGGSGGRYRYVYLLARRQGYALGSRGSGPLDRLDLDAGGLDVDLVLPPEDVVRGRLVDLQGQPVPRVRLRVINVWAQGTKPSYALSFSGAEPLVTALRCWPTVTTTDAAGRFSVRGLRRRWRTTLLVHDDRFGYQQLSLNLDGKDLAGPVTLSVAPPHVVTGTVTYADTGRPVPHARVKVHRYVGGSAVHYLEARADDRGRFRVLHDHTGNYYITALPSAGQPYLHTRRGLTWPKGKLLQEGVELALPRGVLVRGRVVEKPSGKPVSGACLQFAPFLARNPFADRYGFGRLGPFVVSGPDGRFELAVLPGPGHLLVNGPTVDYIPQHSSDAQLYYPTNTANWRYQADAIAPLDLKPDSPPSELTVTLHRGVTVLGRLIGPRGEAVDHAILFRASYHPTGFRRLDPERQELRHGEFELRGCDPDKAEPVVFADPDHRWGAAIQVSGKQAGKPWTVRLQPCGSARLRFMDEHGAPVAGIQAHTLVEMPLAPGISFAQVGRSTELVGITANLGMLDPKHWQDFRTDRDGRLTVPMLIHGATFRILVPGPSKGGWWETARTFTAEAGKTLDLGDITFRTYR